MSVETALTTSTKNYYKLFVYIQSQLYHLIFVSVFPTNLRAFPQQGPYLIHVYIPSTQN